MTSAGQWGPWPFIDSRGRALPGVTVSIYDTTGTTLATLYADRARAVALANPLPTGVADGRAGVDTAGNGIFWAEPDEYLMVVRYGGTQRYQAPITISADPDDANAVLSVNGRAGMVIGLAEQSDLAAEATARANADTAEATARANADAAHEADTTAVHGIANTALLETTSGAQAKADAKVTDALVDGVTTVAPSQNAVFDALATKPTASLDTDGALAANSDTRVPSQKAVKTYADQLIAAADAMVFKGVIDCSGNPNYPAADRGNTYRVSVAGKIGGASGLNVEAGDLLTCLTDGTVSGTQAAVGASWSIAQANIDGAVTGPASSTDNDFATFNGAGGKVVKDSGLAFDTDAALAANSDARVASQKAVKAYADAKVADAINDGTTGVAPSQNAVFDALAGKQAVGTSVALSTVTAADDLIVGTGASAVTNLAVAASRIIGKKATGGLGALTAAEVKTLLALTEADVSGLVADLAAKLSATQLAVVAAPTGVAATDTAAINAAIAALPALGGTVRLQRGDYAINATITIPIYVTLEGEGTRGSRLLYSGTSYCLLVGNTTLGSALAYGCGVRNLSVVCSATAGSCIHAVETAYLDLRNLYLQGTFGTSTGTALFIDGGNTASLFASLVNIQANHVKYGFKIASTGSSYVTTLEAHNCAAVCDSISGSIGLFIDTPSQANRWYGGNFESCATGVSITGHGNVFDGARFEGNTLDVLLNSGALGNTLDKCIDVATITNSSGNLTNRVRSKTASTGAAVSSGAAIPAMLDNPVAKVSVTGAALKTLSDAAAYVDVDVSANVPPGAKMLLVAVLGRDTSTGSGATFFLRKGQTDGATSGGIGGDGYVWRNASNTFYVGAQVWVGLDSARKFQYKPTGISAAGGELYIDIVGYAS